MVLLALVATIGLCYTAVSVRRHYSGQTQMKSQRLSENVTKELQAAVTILKRGGVVAFPTDTVYGLGCDPFCADAVARVFDIKGRPQNMPLPLLVADMEQIEQVSSGLPEAALRLAKKFWPGALTLIALRSARLPRAVTSGKDLVGIRMPNHVAPLYLAKGLGHPIVGTSANISGSPSTADVREVRRSVGGMVDMVLNVTECGSGVESTVVDVTGLTPKVLREGAIKTTDIMKIFWEVP